MISTRALLLLFGFLTAVVIPTAWGDGAGAVIDEEDDEYADPEVVEPALLVAYKSVKTAKIVQGCNVTIAVSLYNVGKGSATDVSVEDVLPQDFEVIEGKLTSSYGTLDPGASVDMEYIAIPRVGDNKFLVRPAKVVYTSAKETKPRTLLSTTPYMDVLSTRQNMELHLVKVGRRISFGQLNTAADWWRAIKAVAVGAFFLWINYVARRHAYRTGQRRELKKARLAKQAQHAAARGAGVPVRTAPDAQHACGATASGVSGGAVLAQPAPAAGPSTQHAGSAVAVGQQGDTGLTSSVLDGNMQQVYKAHVA